MNVCVTCGRATVSRSFCLFVPVDLCAKHKQLQTHQPLIILSQTHYLTFPVATESINDFFPSFHLLPSRRAYCSLFMGLLVNFIICLFSCLCETGFLEELHRNLRDRVFTHWVTEFVGNALCDKYKYNLSSLCLTRLCLSFAIFVLHGTTTLDTILVTFNHLWKNICLFK